MPIRPLMGMLEKLETLINNLLILIGDLFMRLLSKIVSPKVQNFFIRIKAWIVLALAWIKNLPTVLIKSGPLLFGQIKTKLFNFNYKEKLQQSYNSAMAQYANNQSGSPLSKLKTFFMTPFLMMAQWLKGLSVAQTILLLGFSSASVLACISMVFTGQQLVNDYKKELRGPASVEEEVTYDRPDYYKKESRHLMVTNLRLPIYFADVNDLHSMDIDFSATISSRLSRMKLERLKLQLRDHLVLNVEPMLATFPLNEEGKEIIRSKLIMEINAFMLEFEIEGEVKDLKLIYVLGN